MKCFLLFCGMYFLMVNAWAQSRVFLYDPWLKPIYTNHEVSGYVYEKRNGNVNQLTVSKSTFEFMDDQLRPIVNKVLTGKSLYMYVLSTARLGNMLGVMYSMDDTGIMTDMIRIYPDSTVQQYREDPIKRNYPFYRNDQQIIAMPGVGFACYYGRKYHSKIQFLDTTGRETGSVIFPYKTDELEMIYEGRQLHFLADHVVAHYDLDKQVFLPETRLDGLEVLRFDVDPVTEKPYVSGVMLHPKRQNKKYAEGRYTGFFSMEMDGKITYTNWGLDTVVPIAPKSGVRNFRGNTVFAGGRVAGGEFVDPFFMEVDSSGRIVGQDSFPTKHHRAKTMNPVLRNGHQSFWSIITEKNVYLVVTDMESTFIYDLETRKVILKDQLGIIFPVRARKGHVIIREVYEQDGDSEIRYSIRDFEALMQAAKR